MPQHKYIVRRVGDQWTICFLNRQYDCFPTQEAAVERALHWAQNGILQGHRVRVVIDPEDAILAKQPLRLLPSFWRGLKAVRANRLPGFAHH